MVSGVPPHPRPLVVVHRGRPWDRGRVRGVRLAEPALVCRRARPGRSDPRMGDPCNQRNLRLEERDRSGRRRTRLVRRQPRPEPRPSRGTRSLVDLRDLERRRRRAHGLGGHRARPLARLPDRRRLRSRARIHGAAGVDVVPSLRRRVVRRFSRGPPLRARRVRDPDALDFARRHDGPRRSRLVCTAMLVVHHYLDEPMDAGATPPKRTTVVALGYTNARRYAGIMAGIAAALYAILGAIVHPAFFLGAIFTVPAAWIHFHIEPTDLRSVTRNELRVIQLGVAAGLATAVGLAPPLWPLLPIAALGYFAHLAVAAPPPELARAWRKVPVTNSDSRRS